jgi:sarcosine oxidase
MQLLIKMNTELDRRDFNKVWSASTLSALTCGLSNALTAAAAEPPSAKLSYDCIVLGLGAMGSACVYQLAKRGASVLGLEQFDIAHVLGSSGGISRQTKVMPYLGGRYEPLIRRANQNWRTLEEDCKQQVFHQCGYLQLGPSQRLPRGEGTEIELLDESALAIRFPQFQKLPKGTNGILDHQGGLLRSELAIASHCHVALRHGAHIHAQEPVTNWSTDGDGVSVTTKRGKYRAKHLVIAAGAWNAKLIPQLRGKLRVTRLSLGWFAPKDPASFSVDKFPVWLHGAHYGFPVLPDFPGFKVAKHWGGDPTDPDKVDRVPNESDEKLVRDYLSVHLPSANGSVLAFKVCMYTHGGPCLGPLPGEKRVTFIAACNGGGFKFSSAYGEALADLATGGKTDLPVEFMVLG